MKPTPAQALAILAARQREKVERAERELSRRHLIDFAQYTFNAYQAEAFHHSLAAVLERVFNKQITRLIVIAPPQHGKSELVSVRFPAWWLGRRPIDRVLLTSYAAGLAHAKSRQSRNLVESTEYGELFGAQSVAAEPVTTSGDSRAMNAWSLANGLGGMLAAGVGGGITGHGADLGIIDDPVENDERAQSRAYRDMEWEWYQTTFRTRIHDGSPIVILMTRWHEDDLTGRLIRSALAGGEQFTIVRYAAIAETQEERDANNRRLGLPAGLPDPLGRAPGEPLAPGRYSKEELARIRLAVGARAWAALYQGSPRPLEGRILRSELLKRVSADAVPKLVRIVRRWDLAFSEANGADYVSGAKVGIDANGARYILHIKRIHGRWPDSKRKIIEQSLSDGTNVTCAIEANGTQLGYYQDIRSDAQLAGRAVVIADRPQGSKEMRASVWGSRLEDGVIACVLGEWNQEFFDEMDAFPNGEHDDMIDAVSGGMALVANRVSGSSLVSFTGRAAADEEDM